MKKRIVIVYGGKSVESEISILTALKVFKELKKVNPFVYLVYLDKKGNFYSGKGLLNLENYVSLKDFKKVKFDKKFSLCFFKHINRTYFDEVLILGHGKNIEDGTLSSYFETLDIPYLYDDLSNSSIFIDKIKTKLILKTLNIPLINYQVLHSYQNENKITLDYPLIIKPSRLGSSIGIEKVNSKDELKSKLISSFRYDETLLIEEFIENKIEYNIAILGYQNKLIISDVEEVSHNDQVLSFYDKYDYSKGNEKRVIAPIIDSSLKEKIVDIVTKIFNELNLCGLYRFDMIFDKKVNEIYLNEINSLPGSLAYYLFESKGIKMSDLVLMYIDILENKNKNRNRLLNSFEEGFINNVDLDKLKK